MLARADAPGTRPGSWSTLVGRFGCILMIIVNILIVTGLVLLAHAASSVGSVPVDDPGLAGEVGLGLSFILIGFALDAVGIGLLGLAHLLAAWVYGKALGARGGSAFAVGLATAILCFVWIPLTQAWRGFFPPPGANVVRDILTAFQAGNFNVARYVTFGSAAPLTTVSLMVAAAVLLLVIAGLHAVFLTRVARTHRFPRKLHLTQWPVLAVVNLISTGLLAVALLQGSGQTGIASLGAIAGGGLKLLLVPTLGVTVYLSVFRNFQDLNQAPVRLARPALSVPGLFAPRPTGAGDRAIVTPGAAAPEEPILPPTPAPALAPAPEPTRAAPARPAPPPTVVVAAPPPREPVRDLAARPASELSETDARAEIARHEAAIRKVEDLYLSGRIEIEAYADIKRTRSARLAELRSRLEPPAPAVPQPALVVATPAPDEARPAAAPMLPTARHLDLAPSTRTVEEMTMDEISEEIQRNQRAAAAAEEMYRRGEIDEGLFQQVNAARRGRNVELQSRYDELRFDMLTAEPPETEDAAPGEPDAAPEEEAPESIPEPPPRSDDSVVREAVLPAPTAEPEVPEAPSPPAAPEPQALEKPPKSRHRRSKAPASEPVPDSAPFTPPAEAPSEKPKRRPRRKPGAPETAK